MPAWRVCGILWHSVVYGSFHSARLGPRNDLHSYSALPCFSITSIANYRVTLLARMKCKRLKARLLHSYRIKRLWKLNRAIDKRRISH